MAETEQQNGHLGRAARWREAEHEAQTRATEVRQSLTLD
jgi:hypothetical protein